MSPKIYVICLATYINKRFHGVWLKADQDVNVLETSIFEMLNQSLEPGANEFVIYDTEDFFELKIDAYESLENISAWAKFIVKHGKIGAAFIRYCDGDMDHATTLIKAHYHHAYATKSNFVD